ncbi:hypothetical protein HK097_010839 [Rhizophlyctis rosea]|uniref:Thiamine phosphate synthase/TenI domain-containing protein n=1 Tax=Rhizophlyctis rosea TaxID=64517 RepID=A0AAD5SH98_9FUNG|nr:hypothetical protein HK097_010839 [Rhizophlyctis rosea]
MYTPLQKPGVRIYNHCGVAQHSPGPVCVVTAPWKLAAPLGHEDVDGNLSLLYQARDGVTVRQSKPVFDPTLYLVTDRSLLPPGVTLVDAVRSAISGGVTLVQLREKFADTCTFVRTASAILTVCREANVPLLINDRIDIALAVGADGVHVGQDDMPLDIARRLLGPDKILGVTCETVLQAVEAAESGLVDYIGTAAVFETATKKHKEGFEHLGIAGVKRMLEAVRYWNIPVVTIGGLKLDNIEQVLVESRVAPGANGEPPKQLAGIVVVSAIIAQTDAAKAAGDLLQKIRPLVGPTLDSLISRPSNAQAFVDKLADALTLIREKRPMIHNITNYVVMNDTANTILHLGGSPVMAHANEEVADMVKYAGALVINIGTLSPQWIESMHTAAKQATTLNKPIILDPVGAGATQIRTETAISLLRTHHISILKGNAGEISAIAGTEGVQTRGVDSIGTLANPSDVAKTLSTTLSAQHSGKITTVAISGEVDYVSDGTRVVECGNGNEWLGTLTGTGCTTAALTGCFAAVEGDQVVAAVGGIVALGVAAEIAVERLVREHGRVEGPASFKRALYDALYRLDADAIRGRAKITLA